MKYFFLSLLLSLACFLSAQTPEIGTRNPIQNLSHRLGGPQYLCQQWEIDQCHPDLPGEVHFGAGETLLKVKSMSNAYLDILWIDGAMAGESQNQSYFIKVGFGATMTPNDILQDKMIVEAG